MKILDSLITNKDIKEQLAQADDTLSSVGTPWKGVTLRIKKEGAVSHLYLYDTVKYKYVGVTSVQKDVLDKTRPIKGVRVFQSGLLKEYKGFGFLWHVIDKIGETHRVFSSPSTTSSGRRMWVNRLETDHRHAYLIYRVKPFNTNYGDVNYFPIRSATARHLMPVIWDGSYQTRLIMTNPKDILFRRLNFDKSTINDIRIL